MFKAQLFLHNPDERPQRLLPVQPEEHVDGERLNPASKPNSNRNPPIFNTL